MEDVPIPLGAGLTAVVVLIFMNSFFAASEWAIVNMRSGRFQSLVGEGQVRARYAREMADNAASFLSVCQLGITLSSLGLGFIGIPTLAAALRPVWHGLGAPQAAAGGVAIVVSFLLIASLHMVLGERLPKVCNVHRAEAVCLWAAIPLTLFYRLAQPYVRLLDRMPGLLMKGAGQKPAGVRDEPASGEELRHLMKDVRSRGVLDQSELELVDNIFGFSETTAREIMIPRTEMICLYAGRSYEANMAIALEEMLTRYPVCDPDKDNIIGFIHIKDLLHAGAEQKEIRQVIRPLLHVPESIPISALLQMMQKRRTQIALLIDEYGGTSGLVTAEDILEEIVGDIQDEFDEERPAIEPAGAQAYSVDGLLLIEEVNERLGLCIITEDYDTIGGWLYDQLESPPRHNQRLRAGLHELAVEEVDHLRISRILIRRMEDEEGETVA